MQHKALRIATRDEDKPPQPKRACMEFVKPRSCDTPGPGVRMAVEESPLLVTTHTRRVADGWMRCPSPEYVALTQDFHHPAFLAQMSIPLRKKGEGVQGS